MRYSIQDIKPLGDGKWIMKSGGHFPEISFGFNGEVMLSSITSVSPTHHTGVLLHLGRRGCDRDGYLETQHDRLCDGQQGRRQGPSHQHHGHQAFHHLGEGVRVGVKNQDHVIHV